MSHALATRSNAMPAVMNFNGPQLELIKKTVANDTNDDEFNLFIQVSKLRGLNPFLKQIYAVVYSKDDAKRRKMSIITGIDGYRTIAARCRDYRPDETPPQFEVDDTKKSSENPEGIVKCVVRCFKLGPDNQWYAVAGEAYWEEYAPLKEDDDAFEWVDTGEKWPDSGKAKMTKRRKPGDFKRVPDGKWLTMPRVMIAKCAEVNALRKGWPEDFSGIYVTEEMDRSRLDDMLATDALDEHARDQRLMRVGGNSTIAVVWNPGQPMAVVQIDAFADAVLAHARKITDHRDLMGWMETNAVALNQFWARHKSDALELKKQLEARVIELKGAAA